MPMFTCLRLIPMALSGRNAMGWAADCKEEIVRSLGGKAACIGNGFNDIKMFDIADLSIAIMDGEGVCAGLIAHSDALVRSAEEGLDLLLKTDRLRATLRT